jgi:hypothetical protein
MEPKKTPKLHHSFLLLPFFSFLVTCKHNDTRQTEMPSGSQSKMITADKHHTTMSILSHITGQKIS